MLPTVIQKNIQSLLESTESITAFKQAREQLTKSYRASDEQKKQGFSSPTEALAYIAARMPATYAAVETALSHVPIETIESVLDLGAGPGTASLAAALRWPSCNKLHLVEGNKNMYDISQILMQNIPELAHQTLDFTYSNLLNYSFDRMYDIAILSYALNELASRDQTQLITNVWEHIKQGIVIVVPGTPKGYRQLMTIREKLIYMGAFIAAPCPHDKACPLTGEDWCHFSVRLHRSSLHQRIKDAQLSYEDEKYSYIVAVKDEVERPSARIVRKPIKRSGHITMDLCTFDGIKRRTYSRRDKELYKQACHKQWGDLWNEAP